MTRWIRPVLFLGMMSVSAALFAQEPPPATQPAPQAAPPVQEVTTPALPEAAPPLPEAAPPVSIMVPMADTDTNPAETVAATLPTPSTGNAARYGFGGRMRWVSVPKVLLKAFTKSSMPMSSYAFAVEGIRRKKFKDNPMAGWEINMAVGYQDMSPADGNWLGKNKEASIDTDLVQFRGFGLITWDATFIGRQYFSPYFGMHYGAGLGLGIVKGKVLRTSAAGCTDANVSDMSACKPIVCVGGTCTEAQLKDSESRAPDRGPTAPSRFREDAIPGAVPIIHLLFGLDFPIPDAKGLEFKLEGGFYDAFFLGGAAGYVF